MNITYYGGTDTTVDRISQNVTSYNQLSPLHQLSASEVNSSTVARYNSSTQIYRSHVDGYSAGGSLDQYPVLCLLVLLPIVAGLGSVATCLAVRWDARLHHISYYFVASLATLHALMTVTVIPSALVVTWQGQCKHSST